MRRPHSDCSLSGSIGRNIRRRFRCLEVGVRVHEGEHQLCAVAQMSRPAAVMAVTSGLWLQDPGVVRNERANCQAKEAS